MRALLLAFLALACQPASASSSTSTGSAEPKTDAAPATQTPCNTAVPTAWCASPPGDPCGAYHDANSCRAARRCTGIRYTGESVVACRYDAAGFATNCPTVGCISR